jgi:phage terminase large subunit
MKPIRTCTASNTQMVVEEAQTITARSLELLLPTIRVPNSQVWFSWNPRRKSDAVDKLFRGEQLPNDTRLVRCGFDTNPWHNQTMEGERQRCLELTPESYAHVWKGDYQRVTVGAYFAPCLIKVREEGRIVANLTLDPLISVLWQCGAYRVREKGERYLLDSCRPAGGCAYGSGAAH